MTKFCLISDILILPCPKVGESGKVFKTSLIALISLDFL